MNKAIKTKNQISKALIELLNNKPLDLITIKELAKKAEISRTAFYNNFNNHYKNKFIREHAFYFISYYHGSLFNICTYWITNGKQESIETLFKIIKEFEKIKFIQKAI